MSKLNAIRLININYNNNMIRINDETMYFNGENTLISLQNGGGKTVLVQMMMAPFVHKRYRSLPDRPFENFFTTNKPSFILAEWTLDGGAGRMMNGFMVRRNQSDKDEQTDMLEITGIISEYGSVCMWDINNLPVVEKTKKEMTLKGYAACVQIFDGFKKDREAKFFHYDMNNSGQQRQYFDKLMDYRVDYREWEDIIRKINLKEGGLTELFSDCKDEKSLMEKWFLESIEKKLDKEGTVISDFEKNVGNYVRQYYENEDKIKRRDTIEKFKEQVIYDDEAIGRKSVKTYACEFLDREEKKKRQESLIASFRKAVSTYHDETEKLLADKTDELEGIHNRIVDIKHEMISYEILMLADEKKKFEDEVRRLDDELHLLEEKRFDTEKMIGILNCRKEYDRRNREKQDYNDIAARLKAATKQSEDTMVEREELGSLLYALCEEELASTEKLIENVEEDINELQGKSSDIKDKLTENQDMISELSNECGRLIALIGTYDEKETNFNTRYHCDYSRNILGRYEEGFFEIEMEKCLKSKLNLDKELKSCKEKRHNSENAIRRNDSDKSNALIEKVKNEEKRKRAEVELSQYNDELEVRRNMLKYIELPDDVVFDSELIKTRLTVKINELDVSLGNLKMQEAKEKKEYEALSQGRIYELPNNLKAALDSLSIPQVYGLNWLKNNGKTVKENMGLVKKNPFIPYALIMTENEYDSFKRIDSDVYSSLPVPIILRKNLESGNYEVENGTIILDGIRFYIRFNDNLLDEKEFSKLLLAKQDKVKELVEKIERREEEKREYNNKLGILNNQKVTKQLFEEKQAVIRQCKEDEERIADEIIRLENERGELEKQINDLNAIIDEMENKVRREGEKLDELKILAKDYDSYLVNLRNRKHTEDEKVRIESYNNELRNNIDKINEELRDVYDRKNKLIRDKNDKNSEMSKYQLYSKVGESLELSDDDRKRRDVYAADYRAITEELDNDVKKLEKEHDKQINRLRTAENDYRKEKNKLSEKTRLSEDELDSEIKNTVYDEEEDSRLSKKISELAEKNRSVMKARNEADKNISLKEQSIDNKLSDMERECGKKEPVPEDEIVSRNYKAEISKLEYKKDELYEDKKKISGKLNELSVLLSGMLEYSDFEISETVEYEKDIRTMDRTELERERAFLVRDYNNMGERIQKARNELDRRIRAVIDISDFHDEYYRKHLESMLRLVDTPAEVLRQIELTITVFDNQMKKIAVDLALVEKERTNISGELMEYINAVHRDISKIDDNSTITIRDRAVKMLDIKTLDWQENEELFNMRMREFIDELTRRGVELYKNGENASEYFGTQLNTKNLYVSIVGLGNVQIRLYKIEEQREYPIAWSEVAANSGGEGFLSSFVILSSLLHYIRKDDTDLFAERNESKVMIMDNPFGITYSEHLLKPLMEMAKKNNTQLICLSGLGGDSIYGRFDNIYILNRVAASLKSGQQFLRMEHFRGAEPETIVVSNFEVGEQMTLF